MMGIDAGGVCATSDKDPFWVGEELRLPAKDGSGGCRTTQSWAGEPSWFPRSGELARGEGGGGEGIRTPRTMIYFTIRLLQNTS